MRVVIRPEDATHADRQRRYRQRQGDAGRAHNAARMRKTRATTLPEFIGVDSEGIGRGKNHRVVLLGVGKCQYEAKNMRAGLHHTEVFEFLYSQFLLHPKAAFVGFYLSYDFNNWLKTLPKDKAWLLLTLKGQAMRKMTETKGKRNFHPVRVDGWEIDMLGFKRLSLRPIPKGCKCGQKMVKCSLEKHPSWMHVCDAGSFFQMSFVNVLNPDRWKDDPGGPICDDTTYQRIQEWKDKRPYFTRITKGMREYNIEENLLLSIVMGRLASGFLQVGIRLSKDQWYGPGATAQVWLRHKHAVRSQDVTKIMPDYFWIACRRSYFGGWFEIFSHGLIYGISWNYDINNAYPYATTKLPHICSKCSYKRGNGSYKGSGSYVLLHCTVSSKNKRIGPVPYRDKDGNILRPSKCKGWYWLHEIDAARRAGLVKGLTVHKWVEFIQCQDEPPFTEINDLYELRLKVGKDSAQGMAIKLNNNSIYGKFAQSVGSAPFNNWFYASYITSHCRAQILDAIATHPGGYKSVLMVATDGICFDSPHPTLPISKKLGEWGEQEFNDLCLFKPGVYWHHEGKEALLKVKSRGVPKAEFTEAIGDVEIQFRIALETKSAPGSVVCEHKVIEHYGRETLFGDWDCFDQVTPPSKPYWTLIGQTGWPNFYVPVKFRLKSCKQALNEGNWNGAAEVQEATHILQSSEPYNKRDDIRYNAQKNRIDSTIHDLPEKEIETKYYQEIVIPRGKPIGVGFDGDATDSVLEAITILRDKPSRYDISFDENDYEWETVWSPT